MPHVPTTEDDVARAVLAADEPEDDARPRTSPVMTDDAYRTDDPLRVTFDALAASSRAEADDVLIAAAGGANPVVRERAGLAILRRGSSRGLIELVRRFDDLPEAVRRRMYEPSDPLSRALRLALKQGDEPLVRHALFVAAITRRPELIPAAVEHLRSGSADVRREATDAVVGLVDQLYDRLWGGRFGGRTGDVPRGDAERLRTDALDALAAELEPFSRLPDPHVVVESILVLGTPKDAAVAKALRQASPECRRLAGDLLVTSRHPGVLRLAFEFFSEPYPPRKVFDALRTRDDPEFVAALLRWFPAQLTPVQAANVRQIDALPWLSDPDRIAELPEGLQGRLPAFVLATGLPDARKMEIQEWVVRHGSAAGRRSAAQVFDRLDFETTRRILLEGLDSDDEDVSAWATSQLRNRHVPGAFKLLVDRLEDGSEVVRSAARVQLKGFTVEHVVSIHDRLGPALCRGAADLLRKIDPDYAARLAGLIRGPIRRQRIAAAQAAGRLGMVSEVRHALLGLLTEEDTLLRRVGIEVLASDHSPDVVQALRELLGDRSVRVRQAAAEALALLASDLPVGA